MAVSIEAKIDNALLARVAALATNITPNIVVANPNRAFTPPQDSSNPPKPLRHFRVTLFRTPANQTAFRTKLISGIMQVSVYSPENEGPIKASELAGLIIDWFDPQLPWLTSEGVTVRIDPGRPPYASSPLQDVPWWHVPVTINWFSQVNS